MSTPSTLTPPPTPPPHPRPRAQPIVLERTISPIAPDGCFDSVDGVLDDPDK